MSRLLPIPEDWVVGVTRVRHPEVTPTGTFVGQQSTHSTTGTSRRRGWIGVLVLFDGDTVPVDVHPDDLEVIR